MSSWPLQALLGDPHAPFVLVYAGTSTATLERSQRMLVEHCLPLETFLKVRGKNMYILGMGMISFSLSLWQPLCLILEKINIHDKS